MPDATITQESFKIVVETKMSDWFYSDQLLRHLSSFSDEKYKVLITLAPEQMERSKKDAFELELAEFNKDKPHPVLHINTTFEGIANAIQEVIDDRDYEMQDVLDDYLNYCYHDGLIANSDSWKYLRVQLAGATFDFNKNNAVYYDNAERGFRSHDYLGLYTNKSVRAIGKIVARIVAVGTPNGIDYECEFGKLTEERKATIQSAVNDGYSHGYDLLSCKHRYFFVDKFYDTDFKKISSRAPMGSRVFDLTQVLELKDLPDINQIASLLSEKTWE